MTLLSFIEDYERSVATVIPLTDEQRDELIYQRLMARINKED